jgi:hypothetical protein
LAAVDSHEFAVSIVRDNHSWATEGVRVAYRDFTEPLVGESLLRWLRSLMWREYALGVHAPAKMLVLLPPEQQELKFLLSTQIADEWKHAQIFSQRVRELGGDGDISRYQPSEPDWEVYRSTCDWDHPEEIAASLNVTGEVWLQLLYKHLADGAAPRLDPETARTIREQVLEEPTYAEGGILDDQTVLKLREEVIPDEGRHIKIGRLLIERMATSPEAQARVLAAVERKRRGLMASHQGLAHLTLAG